MEPCHCIPTQESRKFQHSCSVLQHIRQLRWVIFKELGFALRSKLCLKLVKNPAAYLTIRYSILVGYQDLHFLACGHLHHVNPSRLNHAGQKSKQTVELVVEPFYCRPDDIL